MQLPLRFWKVQGQVMRDQAVLESHLPQGHLLIGLGHLLQILVPGHERIEIPLRRPVFEQAQNHLRILRIVLVPALASYSPSEAHVAGARELQQHLVRQLSDINRYPSGRRRGRRRAGQRIRHDDADTIATRDAAFGELLPRGVDERGQLAIRERACLSGYQRGTVIVEMPREQRGYAVREIARRRWHGHLRSSRARDRGLVTQSAMTQSAMRKCVRRSLAITVGIMLR